MKDTRCGTPVNLRLTETRRIVHNVRENLRFVYWHQKKEV